MAESASYSIEKANFDKQKNRLDKFSKTVVEPTELDIVRQHGGLSDFMTGGIFGVFNHKVTGKEFNNLVTDLQNCLIQINERERSVIKEFGEVYETFEVLDKEYIQGILISVEAARKASEEAKNAQKDVDKTIQALQQTVNKLKEVNAKVDGGVGGGSSTSKKQSSQPDVVEKVDPEIRTVGGDEITKRLLEIENRMDDFEKKFTNSVHLCYFLTGLSMALWIIHLVF